MIDTLTLTQRRLLALAILAAVIMLIFMLTMAPLWAVNRHYQDTIEGLNMRLQILQRSAASGSELRTRHEQLKRSLANNRQYLKGTSEAVAAANLQGIVTRIAQSNRMQVLSTQILPSTVEAGFIRVTLNVRMRGELDNTVRLFHALESGQPYLFLDNLSIRSFSQPRRGNQSVQQLNVDFDLTAYMLQPS